MIKVLLVLLLSGCVAHRTVLVKHGTPDQVSFICGWFLYPDVEKPVSCAVFDRTRCSIFIPHRQYMSPEDYAFTLGHELGHCAGKGH